MLNEELLSAVIDEFGLSIAIDYCLLQAFTYDLKAKDFNKYNPHSANEYQYEKEWFEMKYDQLLTLKLKEDAGRSKVPNSQT